ncbi:phage tail tape measure protein [Simonsiella muelleri]|uniref:phage tail tape measure protein n=1 Tax=Simonsiella muelleri TaxID=72 RepID=UPI0028D8992F|nr:phage tail tape measure protein [Simonsiella muelleri]
MSAELSIVVKIGAAVGGAVGAIRSVVRGVADMGRSTSLLQREYDVLGRAIRRATQSGSADLVRLERQQTRIGNSLRNMTRTQTMQQMVQTRLDMGRNTREQLRSEAMGAMAGMGAVLVPIKAAMDFESSMADVRKVVDFDTPQQFKEMEQQLLNMTHRIPMAATELSKIAASGGQLGIARQDIAGFTETIAKMSVAFDMSADAAGDSMAKLANVYKIPIAKIGELGDAINHLSNSSPAKASDIVNTLGRVGGVAKQFGLTELQTASLSNAFISLGRSPEVAGTAINGMLTKLATAEKGGNKFQAALKSMGVSARDLKRDIAQNGEQALMDFLKAVNKLPKDKQMGTLVDLFGLEYADDVAVLTGSLETYQKSIDALKNGKDGKPIFSGSMDKEFAARSATTANNWQLFKNQMQHLAISIGSVMLPTINALLNEMKPLVDSFIRFAQTNPDLIKKLFLGAAALASFRVGSLVARFGLSLFGSAIFGTVGRLLAFGGALLRVRSVLQLLNMGRRSVLALRMLGLSAAQARVLLAGLGRVGSLVSGSLKLVGAAFGWLGNAARALIGFLPMIGQAFMALGRVLLMTPIGLALGLMATAAYLLYTRWGAVVGGAKLLWQDLSRVVSLVATSITTFFSTSWATITAVFNTAMNAILTRIQTFSPVTAFQTAFAAVSGFFSSLVSTFMSYGGMLIDGLANGIRAKIGNVLASVRSMAASVKSAFTGAMQIHSPSRVFRSYGGFITEGLAIGVNKTASKPVGKISQLAGSLKNRFTERMSGFRSDLSARLSANADALSQARTEAQVNQINNGGAITIHFNPTINAADSNPQQIETALQMGLREFEDLFKRMMADQQRRAY